MKSKCKEPKAPRTTLSGTKASHNQHTHHTSSKVGSAPACCDLGRHVHPLPSNVMESVSHVSDIRDPIQPYACRAACNPSNGAALRDVDKCRDATLGVLRGGATLSHLITPGAVQPSRWCWRFLVPAPLETSSSAAPWCGARVLVQQKKVTRSLVLELVCHPF
jgi:hypothetical protein